MKKLKIVVVDGHDGSGKTTIAKCIAEEYGMKYIKPFSESLGDLIAWSYRQNKFEFANDVSLAAVDKQLSENKGMDLVFDRHWLSMFTVLPIEFHSLWKRPITICCWADVNTTISRLRARNETEVNEWNHEYYCDSYKRYAEQYGAMLLNTSDNDDVKHNMKLVKNYLKSVQGD